MAIFDFDEHTEIDTVWIVDLPQHNTVAVLYRQAGDEQWTLKIRFRREVDDKVFDSNDTKRVMTVHGSLEVLRPAARQSLSFARVLGGGVRCFPIRGGFEKFLRALQNQPGMHFTEVPGPPTSSSVH